MLTDRVEDHFLRDWSNLGKTTLTKISLDVIVTDVSVATESLPGAIASFETRVGGS